MGHLLFVNGTLEYRAALVASRDCGEFARITPRSLSFVAHPVYNPMIVCGDALFAALVNTKSSVKWIHSDACPSRARHIPADKALLIARAGVYVGKIHAGRVRYIREVDPRTKPLFDPLYLEGRAVVRFHADQNTVPPKVRQRHLADMWARLLALDPPPKSWVR